jgi:transposase
LIDYQDSHGLDVQLPSLRHLLYRQEKRVCPKHPEVGVVMGPAPERPIAQALPTAMLLAFLVVAKVQDHLPLERLSGMFKRWGTRISPSTLGGWYQAAGELVLPLAQHLGAAILANDACMHTDGTNIRVVDPKAPRGSTNGSLWGYTVAGVGAYFEYTPDGSYDDKLSARTGPTMTDGHKGYVSQRVAGQKQTIPVINGTHLNCFDHARRPFEAAYRLDGDPRAGAILSRLQSLYRVEAEAKRDGLSVVQIKALRARKSRPLFDKLFKEIESLQPSVTPKSRLGGAIATTIQRKPQLEAYLSNGSWPISNVIQETQFRSKAIGQHNWLFLGSHAATPHYAALLTLVRSCALLDIDPVAYLADVFMRLQQRGSAKNLDSLLPAAWKQSNADAQRQGRTAA